MVDALVSVALENLARLGTDEVRLLIGTREEVNQLSSTFTSIQASLVDAEMRQIKDKAVQDWLQKLKYVAYEMDDLIDEWKVKLQQLSNNETCHGNSVWNFFIQCTCFQHLVMRHDIGKKIKEKNKKLDQIANEKDKFNFRQIIMPVGDGNIFSNFVGNSRSTSSWVDESDVFGREHEKKEIKSKLINEGSSVEADIPVISIVGMGGLGKTTLSQSVFNDAEVKRHFQEQIWVCISDEFDVQKIIKKIVEVIKKETPNVDELEALQRILWENLEKKRFLLVLDDVWNENYSKWEKLINIIKKCGAKGSRILVTTRLQKVAQVMASTYTCQLRPLSPNDCLSVFKKVAFQGRFESEHSELMEIGEKIVERCKGLPLAIKCVAGALRTKRTRRDWENLLSSPVWDWDESKADIQPALLLSYYHLSPQLKQCFRYCCIYPKDYDIEKKTIVNLWVAQGYIPLDGNMEAEDIGEEYYEELLARSLFQEPKRDEYAENNWCKMHDLVHDLAQFVSKGEIAVINVSKDNPLVNVGKTRHCNCNLIASTEAHLNCLTDAENLRTLLMSGVDVDNHKFDCLVEQQLQCVRVLEIRQNFHQLILGQLPKSIGKLPKSIGKLPKSIGKLVHLKYLDLSFAIIEALPESFMKLRNLSHLQLRIKTIPMSFAKLENLRFLNLQGLEFETFPEPITKLRNLRHLDLSDSGIKALPESIEKLENLRHLHLAGTRGLEEISKAIGKLKQLRCLKLKGTGIRELPESITELPHLQVLDVSHCEQLSRLPDGIHKLTGLKTLAIGDLFSHLNLKRLPTGIGKLTSLRRLDTFIVTQAEAGGGGGSSNLWELRDLNHLCRGLTITNLDEVGSREEAENAKLKNKMFLKFLELTWTQKMFRTGMFQREDHDIDTLLLRKWEEESNQRRAEDVLEALRPHPGLIRCEIEWYPGSKIPCWLQDGTLSALRSLSLYCWPNCTQLSALGNLPQLSSLFIGDMSKLRKLGGDFFGSKNGFPILISLRFERMENWEEWEPLLSTGEEEEGEAIATFPRLRELQISDCGKLKALPPIFSEALADLTISNDFPVLSIPPSIEKLCIWGSAELPSPECLPKLRNLELAHGGELTELPNNLIRFSALQKLEIDDYRHLRSLPEEIISSLKELRELHIGNCGQLEESCKMGGEQWPKIAHIPCIQIGREKIQWNE